MCYAIPAKLIAIQGNIGTLDYFGEERKILLDETEEYTLGDYLYAQGGIAVSKLPESEALEILGTWKDIFFELKRMDQEMSTVNPENLSSNTLAILQHANLGKPITPDEAKHLLLLQKPTELSVLYEVANHVRQKVHGNASCVHGIIEFSNYCKHACYYCGIRQERTIKRYRMKPQEIIEIAQHAAQRFGFKAMVLQSGEDDGYDDKMLEEIVKAIKKMGILVFLSIGLRSEQTYRKLYQAGARAVLLRFETANPFLFKTMRPGTSLTERVQLLKQLKAMGYIIATGFLLGLPQETAEDIIRNLVLTKELQPDMYSFGPLIPSAETPLAYQSKLSKDDVLKVIAVARLMDRDANILVTTALETLDPEAKREALLAGANSMMINITPLHYREQYKIYDNRACNKLEISEAIQDTTKLLFSLGRSPTDIGIHTPQNSTN